jgi:hypothetical protein
MAEDKKLFYPKIEPGDIQTIHPDGGGIVMTKGFKALVGETDGETVDNLNAEGYNGYIDTVPNNANGIFVYSEQSPPLEDNIPVGNENRTSIIEPTPVPVVAPPPTKPRIGLLIGDSQVPDIFQNVKTPNLLITIEAPDTKNGEFWKTGWGLNSLEKALSSTQDGINGDSPPFIDLLADTKSKKKPKNTYIGKSGQNDLLKPESIDIIFICIGTNNGFEVTKANITNMLAIKIELHAIFPNYKELYIIKGSWGWGGVSNKTEVDAQKFADKFTEIYPEELIYREGDDGDFQQDYLVPHPASVLKNAIGYSKTHPGPNTPGVKAVAAEIDSILQGSTVVTTTPSATVLTQGQKAPDDKNPVYDLKSAEIIKEAANDDKLIIGAGEEGIYDVDFNSLPNREQDVIIGLNNNSNAVSEQSGVNTDDLVNTSGITVIDLTNEKKYTTGETKTAILGVGVASTGGGGNVNLNASLNILAAAGAIEDDNILKAVASTKTGANNVIDILINCNPENAPAIYNSSLPKFKKADLCTNPPTDNPILVAIGNKMGPFNGIYGRKSLWCASGLSFAFLAFNQTTDELKTKSTKSGGFPCSTSSYIVPTKPFTGAKTAFVVGADFNTQGQLTDSGIVKFNEIKSYKGAVFTVGNGAQGHIGFILYVENSSKGGWILHTLECNAGRSIKFLKRYIGGNWGAWAGGNNTNIYIGDLSTYTGGAYATNGIGSDYSLTGIGSVKTFYTNNPSL